MLFLLIKKIFIRFENKLPILEKKVISFCKSFLSFKIVFLGFGKKFLILMRFSRFSKRFSDFEKFLCFLIYFFFFFDFGNFEFEFFYFEKVVFATRFDFHIEYSKEDVNFIFGLFYKTKTQRKINISIILFRITLCNFV